LLFSRGVWIGLGEHSHLDNAGYSIDRWAAKKDIGPEEMVDAIIKEDDARGVSITLSWAVSS
jgi:hypothetical protein